VAVVAAEEAVFSRLFEKVSPGRTHNNVGIYVGVLLVCLQCMLVDFLRPHKLRNKYVFVAETGRGGDGERPSSITTNSGGNVYTYIYIIIIYILYLYIYKLIVCMSQVSPKCIYPYSSRTPVYYMYNEFAYNVGT